MIGDAEQDHVVSRPAPIDDKDKICQRLNFPPNFRKVI